MSGLILASRSEIRAALLRAAGIVFQTTASMVDETAAKTILLATRTSPMAIAGALADEKALVVSRREPGLVIGADQTLDLDGRLYDKPASLVEARARLMALRGRTHILHSSVSLARDGQVVWRFVESARLTMRAFTVEFLDAYLAGVGASVVETVGAYQLEGAGAQLFEAVEGDYFAILGMPLIPLLNALRNVGALAQ